MLALALHYERLTAQKRQNRSSLVCLRVDGGRQDCGITLQCTMLILWLLDVEYCMKKNVEES